LKGSIPDSIQNRIWKSIDVSYNKLSGILDYQMKINGSLSYQNNRLSGNIPTNLKSFDGYVNILIGNLFDCSLFHPFTSLPSNDPFKNYYQCGSNNYNFVEIFSLIILIIIFIIKSRLYYVTKEIFEKISRENIINNIKEIFNAIVILPPYFNRNLNLLRNYAINYSKEINISHDERSDDSIMNNIVRLCDYSDKLFYCLKILILFIIILWIPVSIILNYNYNMYTFSYGYTVSNTFLTGISPAIILFILLLFSMIFVFKLFNYNLTTNGDEMFLIKLLHGDNISTNNQSNLIKNLNILFLIIINLIIVLIMNCFYVWAALNYASYELIIIELAFAFTKIFWNSQCIPYLSSILIKGNKDELVILSSIEILNNIIIPFLATAMLSPNCFHNIFYVTHIESNYSFTQCKVLNIITGQCLQFETATTFISFIPPFSYSYQW
jgi:hypothetical protein